MAGHGGKPNQHDARLRRLHVEPLEDRRMLATFAVSNLMDGPVAAPGDLPGSLRQAIFDANNTAGADTIDMSAVAGMLSMTDGEFQLTEAVTIDGPGEMILSIDAQQLSRIFNISAPTGEFTIRGLKLAEGKSIGDNLSMADNTFSGGAIRSVTTGQLTVEESKIIGNSVDGELARGGGIFSEGPLSLVDSSITSNYTLDGIFVLGHGGGISANASLTITGSTISGNGAGSNFGGGLYGTGYISVADSTISDNRGGGGITGVGHIEVTDSTISGNSTLGVGGGIRAVDTLTVTRSTISDNTARLGGGISSSGTALVEIIDSTVSGNTIESSNLFVRGGGILAENVTLLRSTVSGNTATSTHPNNFARRIYGGGIYATGYVSLTQSTVSGNAVNDSGTGNEVGYAFGGGVAAYGVTLTQSTVAYNTAYSLGLGGYTHVDRPGIWATGGPVVITGSIVAGHHEFFKSDLDPGTGSLTVNHSLIGVNTFTGLAESHTPDANGNLVGGFTLGPIFPLLDALRDNGGPTETHALTAISPAIDLGDPTIPFSPTEYDQRGDPFVRVFDADGDGTPRIDIGAFERQVFAPLLVDTIVDEQDGDYSPDDLSLREAVNLANLSLGPEEIFFDSTVFGTPQTIPLTMGQMQVGSILDNSLTIHGPGQDLLTIDAQQNSRIFRHGYSSTTSDFSLHGVTLTGGRTTFSGSGGGGGAIRSISNSNLTINDSTITGNSTTGTDAHGGAIYSQGPVYLNDTTVDSNTSTGKGGGIYAAGDVHLTQSTVSGNTTTALEGDGGGIYGAGAVTLNQSTVSGNSTAASFAAGGGIFSSGLATLTDSTLSGNSTVGGSSDGGGIYSLGGITLTGSTVSGNYTSGNISDGGGIRSFSGGAVMITGSTITGNSVTGTNSDGGGIYSFVPLSLTHSTVTNNHSIGIGGGIWNFDDPIEVEHSIVSDNTAGGGLPDINPGTGTFPVNYSLIGTSVTPDPGTSGNNVVSDVPMLGSLADNGGPTQTHALLPGSPAIDMGDTGFSGPPTYDQRGFTFSRVVGGRIDMGAVESGAVSADFDQDGVVSGLDFLRWQLGAGTTGTAVHGDGDANIDGDVDGADETVWELQYGTVAPLVAAAPIHLSAEASSPPLDSTAATAEPLLPKSGLIDLAIAAELLNAELRTSVVRGPSSVATDHGQLTTDKLALHDAAFRELDHSTRQHQDAAGVLAGEGLVDFSGDLAESDLAHHRLQPLEDVPLGGEFFPDL